MSEEVVARSHGRFTARLEAFSDLVFGFSLSLLATRLDVPGRVEDVFDPTRWMAVIGTFGLVCRFWLEHYRVFRHQFVAEMFDAVVNFVFLFAIAILPYTVQTFLRFTFSLPSFSLYVGDFGLILMTLAILRARSLRHRRTDPDVTDRLRVWRRAIVQGALGLLLGCLLVALHFHGGTVIAGLRTYEAYILTAVAAVFVLTRVFVRKLPQFLA